MTAVGWEPEWSCQLITPGWLLPVASVSSRAVAGFQGKHPEKGTRRKPYLLYDRAQKVMQTHFCHMPFIPTATKTLLKFKKEHVGPEIFLWPFLENSICYMEHKEILIDLLFLVFSLIPASKLFFRVGFAVAKLSLLHA